MPYADKELAKAKAKEYRERNKEEVKARRRAYYQANKERLAAQHRQRYANNKELLARQAKARRSTAVGWAKNCYLRTRHRAEEKNIEFNLSLEDFDIPQVCPVLGLKLSILSGDANASPSIDRIDNTIGYVKSNVHVISDRANRLKRDATLEELILLGAWAQKQKGKEKATCV